MHSDAAYFPHWSPQASSLWAKTDRSDDQSTDWLNLPQHMTDSAQVGVYLWDHYLSPNHRRFIQEQLRLDAENCARLAAFLCGAHDVGKATFSFASQINDSPRYGFLPDKIRAAGLPLFSSLPSDEWSPHSTASYIILTRFFEEKYGPRNGQKLSHLGQILGAHHGLPANTEYRSKAAHEVTTMPQIWGDVHQELLTKILSITQAESAIEQLLRQRTKLKDNTKMLLTGLVIMADWIASNADYFPLGHYEPADQRPRFEKAVAKLRLPLSWSPENFAGKTPTQIYAAKFLWDQVSSPRPVQTAVLDALNTDNPPSMLIIEAPMGEGKTEAALVAAEKLAHLNGCNGIFFGAPTMATTDALFARIKRWAEQSQGTPVVSMYLGHSKNQLNPAYTSMGRYARFNLDDESQSSKRQEHSQVIAHQWFRGRKQGILSSLVVATVDQVLMMALQSKHLMLRHLGLAGKVVVIDEAHSYDLYMSNYMEAALRWLGSYGTPVVLLSATLPHNAKARLAAAYQSGLKGRMQKAEAVPSAGTAYPVITAVSTGDIEVHQVAASARSTTYEVMPMDDGDAELRLMMEHVEREGGCLLVICNTVDRAQAAYDLAQQVVGDDAYLLHSRFTAVERVERESHLVRELGPDSSLGRGRPARRIVVATQVVEQSLDLDFDCMVTDIAPIDLVLQRLGRLHRHHRPVEDRPLWARQARVYVRGMQGLPLENSSPVFSSGVDAVYQSSLLLPTCAELELYRTEGRAITVPQDIPVLVAAVYSNPSVLPAWQTDFANALVKLEEAQEQARGKSKSFRAELSRSVREFSEVWAAQSQDLSDEQGAAQVRDTEPTIEVVLVQKVGDGYYAPLPWLIRDFEQPALPVGFTPDADTAYLLAQSTVRLPYQLSRPWRVDQVLDQLEQTTDLAWQKSHLLKGLLQVTLDENFETEIAGFRLKYSQELGLELLDKPPYREESHEFTGN